MVVQRQWKAIDLIWAAISSEKLCEKLCEELCEERASGQNLKAEREREKEIDWHGAFRPDHAAFGREAPLNGSAGLKARWRAPSELLAARSPCVYANDVCVACCRPERSIHSFAFNFPSSPRSNKFSF